MRAIMVGSVGLRAWHRWQDDAAWLADRLGNDGMPGVLAGVEGPACRRRLVTGLPVPNLA